MRRHRGGNNQQKGSTLSVCRGVAIRGSPESLMRAHEAAAYDAERNEDRGTMHDHFQHADHYKRVLNSNHEEKNHD